MWLRSRRWRRGGVVSRARHRRDMKTRAAPHRSLSASADVPILKRSLEARVTSWTSSGRNHRLKIVPRQILRSNARNSHGTSMVGAGPCSCVDRGKVSQRPHVGQLVHDDICLPIVFSRLFNPQAREYAMRLRQRRDFVQLFDAFWRK